MPRCVVLTRNGEGDALLFGSLRAARVHPIPQMDDVYATTAEELLAQYGRRHADSLLRFAEGRDLARASEAIEEWRQAPSRAELDVGAREILWRCVSKAAQYPPTEATTILDIVTTDREWREGRSLRSFSDPTTRISSTQKEEEMPDEKNERKARTPAEGVITITTEEGKNPKKPGSKAHSRFELYRSGMTVAQAREAGVTASDIAYDQAHGFISVRVA